MADTHSTIDPTDSIFTLTIQSVRPSRLKVVTEDNRIGIIPEREWSWDRRIQRAPPTFEEGQKITAVLIEEKSRSGIACFSIARLSNPWDNVTTRYKKGQVVVGEVVNLRSFAAFVQIEPGITAVVWAKDLPLLVDQIPSDVLVLGDKVCGVISVLDTKKQKIDLDVNVYLEQQADKELDDQAMETYTHFASKIKTLDQIKHPEMVYPNQENYVRIPELYQLDTVLVIDDLEEHRMNIKTKLEKEYGAKVEVAANEKEANEFIENGHQFDLMIIDFRLEGHEKGTDIARKILEDYPQQNLIFFSSHLDIDEKIEELEVQFDRKLVLAQKFGTEIEDLIDCIDLFKQGIKRVPVKMIRNTSLTKGLVGNKSIDQTLDELIKSLLEEEKITHAFLLELNLGTRKAKILAQYPPANEHMQVDVDALYYSPVRQVIEDGEDFHAWRVSPLNIVDDRRLKNLFSNYAYQACFGTVIHLSGQSPKHALFVLDRNREFLNSETKSKITQCAFNIGTTLERHSAFEMLLRSQDAYYKGQLLGAMIHELNNKLVPLQSNLEKAIIRLKNELSLANLKRFEKIQMELNSLNELFSAYTKLAKKNVEGVQLNQIIEKVIKQQQGLAQDKGVEIFSTIDPNLPLIKSNALQIEQIFSNLLLNAIQQIDENLQRIAKIRFEQRHKFENLFSGTVQIKTSFHATNQHCRIEIIDSGPGVPFDKRESIFEWGMTTRESGQGMGLYISRSLMEAMGGQLFLLDSIRFVGSIFVIEFPNL